MTIEQLVAAYIYKHRQLQLQELGLLTLKAEVVMPEDTEKEFVFPENSFEFVEDQKMGSEEAFVDFVTAHTRKIKSLATSDVDSYFNLNKQFINIGKAMLIPGVGSIHKNDKGNLEFTQGKPIYQKITTPAERQIEKEEQDISFSSPKATGGNSGKSNLLILMTILGVLAIAAIAYLALRKKDTDISPVEEAKAVVSDSVANNAVKDSTTSKANVPPVDDGYTYKIVFKDYNSRLDAEAGQKKFITYGHNVLLRAVDSSKFILIIPFTSPAADSVRALDSLRRLFGYPTYTIQ